MSPGAGSTAAFPLTNTPVPGGGGPQLTITGGTVGQGLQIPLTLTLPGPAHVGGQDVTITSGSPSLVLLAGRQNDAGTSSISVRVGEGLTSVTGIYAHGLSN